MLTVLLSVLQLGEEDEAAGPAATHRAALVHRLRALASHPLAGWSNRACCNGRCASALGRW